MSIRMSNASTSIKSESVLAKDINVGNSRSDVIQTQWEPFKYISGLSTDFLNKMLNIPSTAFTPNMVLPSKEALQKITVAYGIIKGLNDKMQKISDVFSGQNSYSSQKKEYLKKMIACKSMG